MIGIGGLLGLLALAATDTVTQLALLGTLAVGLR